MKLVLTLFLAEAMLAQTWVAQNSGTTASLRGIAAVDARVAWASGSGGTCLQTSDGGATWRASTVPGAAALDFRDVHAVDARAAYLLSSGPGDRSRIYKTADGGAHWTLQFTNPDAKGFFDALAFWNARHGIALGDPVDGRFAILTTTDGGEHWERQPGPTALPNEGAFAASGTCLIAIRRREAWFATGGPGAARVFHSTDGGRTWTVSATRMRNDGPSAGIFSLAFSDARHGIAVGGDYSKLEDARQNIAITSDGGRAWTEPRGAPPKGFRSAVAWVADRKLWIACGASGSDVSHDGGNNWKLFDSGACNALSFVSGKAGWAVGPKGRIAAFHLE